VSALHLNKSGRCVGLLYCPLMNDTTANRDDELKALREQLALQQQLLAGKEALVHKHASELQHKQSELEHKQPGWKKR